MKSKVECRSRNWIKGHFYSGLFYGILFGFFIGFSMVSSPIFAILLAFGIYYVKDKLEEKEFEKNGGMN